MLHDRHINRIIVSVATATALILFMSVGAAVAADPAVSCATAKHKAATKKLSDKMKCHDKALKKGEAVDATCLTKAEDKFDGSFTKAEAKGGCLTTGDAAAIEAIIDSTLADLLAAMPGVAPATCNLLSPECSPGEGCYQAESSCADGIGICSEAGAGDQGALCIEDGDCAPGLGCFFDGFSNACLTLCENIGDCPLFTVCTPVQDCPSFGACL